MIMNIMFAPFRVASFFTLALSFSSSALAHSGGLNSQGCHAGSQPYHCHRPPAQAAQSAPFTNPSNGNREVISGQITHVRDGDTFVLGHLPIRLAAVDCPENNTIEGQMATEFMSRYVGATATCELTGETTYDRSVGYCSIDRRDVGLMLFFNTECRVWELYDVWGRY